jgi:hypothetical protein
MGLQSATAAVLIVILNSTIGLTALKLYNHKNPGVEVCDAAITGGGCSAARPVLQTRLCQNR